MMMERAKTAPAPPETKAVAVVPSTSTAPSSSAASASAADRVEDLERRLDMLGGGELGAPATAPAAATTTAAPARPKEPQMGKSNPLLKRIQAAQERARQAEEKDRQAKAAAAAEAARKKREEEEARARAAEEERIARAQSALRSVAGRALEDKQKEILAQLEGKVPPMPPAAAATPGVPIMKSMDTPPPSFDSMKFPPPKAPRPHEPGSGVMVGHGMNSRALTQQQQPLPPPPPPQMMAPPPPSFDFVEQQMMQTPVEDLPPPPPAPTAPSMSPSAPPITMTEDHLHGVMPVAPPMAPQQPTHVDMIPPPPSFADFEQQRPSPPATAGEDEGIFDFDMDGNPISPDQRHALMEEQRRLYESIMKEKEANDAAIARANADAFDQRSSSAAARAMPGGSDSHAAHTQAMDSVGMNVGQTPAAAAAGGEQQEEGEQSSSSRRMVKIGNNQMVALHGQDRTKKAIKEGTAILVQCMNCQNWMQVTDTATLMFCPVCQVVSPVIQQNEVMTKEEAIQLTMDRKLAEKMQAEAYAEQDGDDQEEGEEDGDVWSSERGFFASMFGGGGSGAEVAAERTSSPPSSSASAAAGAQSDSWWNKISSIVSYGVAEEPRERGDVGVARPPGAPPTSKYPAQKSRGSSPAAAAEGQGASRGSPTHRAEEETRGLLSPVVVDGGGNEHDLPAGRVAESRPLFSCIADSVSGAASAVFGEQDAEGNVHGVDGSSLLITNAGRGVGDGAGDYSKLPDRE